MGQRAVRTDGFGSGGEDAGGFGGQFPVGWGGVGWGGWGRGVRMTVCLGGAGGGSCDGEEGCQVR